MKNESLIWSVLPPRCVLWIFPTQAGQTWVISFLVLASKIITAKSRNCQFCQFAIIPSVAGLLSRMCWPMRGRDIGRLTNQRPGADTTRGSGGWTGTICEKNILYLRPILLWDARSAVWQQSGCGMLRSGPQTESLTVNLVFCCYTFYITNDPGLLLTYYKPRDLSLALSRDYQTVA